MFPLSSRDNESSDAVVSPPLSQAVGYVVVVVVGLIIAFGPLATTQSFGGNEADLYHTVMMLATSILKKTVGEDNRKTEMFVGAFSKQDIL